MKRNKKERNGWKEERRLKKEETKNEKRWEEGRMKEGKGREGGKMEEKGQRMKVKKKRFEF